MEEPTYEFTEAQNGTIRVVADRMKWVGMFLIAVGGLYGIRGVLGLAEGAGAFGLIISAVILILTGIWTRNAGGFFSLIVDTAGSDIPHLMDAVESLRKLYTLQFWLMIVGLVITVLAIITSLF